MPTTKIKTRAKPNRKVGAPEGNKNAVGNHGGRPSGYQGEQSCAVASALGQGWSV
jgi:uncharacterized protein YjcR